jgi:hypothetical protein
MWSSDPSANDIRLLFAASLAAPHVPPQHTYPSTQQPHWRFRLDVLSPSHLLRSKDVNVAFLDVVCVSVTQFCENSVKNLLDSYSDNFKYLAFSSLRATLNVFEYLWIAPTPGIYNALSGVGLVSSTAEKGWHLKRS